MDVIRKSRADALVLILLFSGCRDGEELFVDVVLVLEGVVGVEVEVGVEVDDDGDGDGNVSGFIGDDEEKDTRRGVGAGDVDDDAADKESLRRGVVVVEDGSEADSDGGVEMEGGKSANFTRCC